jgi:hypothetical protein
VEEVLLPVAVTEAAVIEYEGREAGLCEALGECSQPVAPRPRQAVSHDDPRGEIARTMRWIEPCGTAILSGDEGNVSSVHVDQTAATQNL